MAAELLRKRPAGRVCARLVAWIDFRQLVAVGAPAALERKRVEIEDHDAPAKGAICGVQLAGRLVQPNLFDLADDHRRGGWILRQERGCGCSRRLLGSRVGAAAPAPLPREGSCRAGATSAGLTCRRRFVVLATAALCLGCARDFLEHLSRL